MCSTASTPTTAATTGPAGGPHSSWGCARPSTRRGFGKADVREAARRLGLPVWDKPALACLSSRFPYGTGITPERLARVAAAERTLRGLGFRVCRVRFHGTAARIEVEPHEIHRLRSADIRTEVVRRFRDAGFDRVTVDPRGYRPGSLNEALSEAAPETPAWPLAGPDEPPGAGEPPGTGKPLDQAP